MRFLAINPLPRLAALLAIAIVSQSGTPGVAPPEPSPTSLTRDVTRLGQMIAAHEYAPGIPLGKSLLARAQASSLPLLEVKARRLLGGAQLATHQYRDALQTLVPAREQALKLKDFEDLPGIDNNLSWVYLEMERLEAAAEYADQALAAQSELGKPDSRPLILRALIYARSGNFPPAVRLFSEAINHSFDSGDLNNVATAWNVLGIEYFNAGRLNEARVAQTESFRLRKLHHLDEMDASMRALGKVLAAEGDLRTAKVLMRESLAKMGDSHSTVPAWVSYRDRGLLRVMQGDLVQALPDLRRALELARAQIVIPTDDDRVTFESRLAELYSLFIDTGNRIYLQTHDPHLKEEIFQASEENRSASLRAVVPQPDGWRNRLPAEHADILAQLEDAERNALTHPDANTAADVRRLRASLDTVEARAGARQDAGNRPALQAARNALTGDSAVIAFHLGKERSWMWAVSSNTFEVYPLAAEGELSKQVTTFRSKVRAGQPSERLPGDLGDELFKDLPADIKNKNRWILALDQELFDLPLAALRVNGRYLIETHALLLTPGVQFLEPAAKATEYAGKLIGIGDAIYNRADQRWRGGSSWLPGLVHLRARSAPESWPLARLTGSGKEVRDAVRIWNQGEALTGQQAVVSNVEKALAERPAILHLATHVVTASRDGRAGMLVFGLENNGEPGFLTMREILLHTAPVGLVVMSGCASGDAQARPATGLMGLTRAWLGAGASEVLATQWPSADDGGDFFDVFYGDLHANPKAGASEALRQAQIAMMKSDSFRSKPAYWGSYFLIGKM